MSEAQGGATSDEVAEQAQVGHSCGGLLKCTVKPANPAFTSIPLRSGKQGLVREGES